MNNLKFIEGKNIPIPLRVNDVPQFCITSIVEDNDKLVLHYQVEGRGFSISVKDHHEFEELPNKIKVVSGGWYGNRGRWAPLERYTGTIICESVDKVNQISDKGEDYSFKVRKPFFSRNKILTIESEKVGFVEIKCKKIIPQKYEIYLFSKVQNQWVLRNSVSFH